MSEDMRFIACRDLLHPSIAALSPARRQVAFLLLTTGLSMKQIAARLGKPEKTISNHIQHIYRVLDVQSRPQFMARYRR